ncbi:synaptonemal complex central element protein 3 isoform X1 [Tympanuchus pallidicinctus]|uniref:synaptonemal complex central element protein 3 isoform X1 n=2 Tax=Tetraoninae TaxID=466585 RepID=UPI0022871AEE|nr:synaptonemal complex central element protein 3 isoform X1 [Tympanuchus pallidicinctus]
MRLDVHLKCFKCFKSTVTRGISSTFIYNKNLKMARQEPQERNYDNMLKMIEDLNRDLEKLLEEMEKLTAKISGLVVFLVFIVQATWMAYDMVVMRTNPDLTNSMRRLEEAFLNCREEMEKKWQEVLRESKGEEQKKE